MPSSPPASRRPGAQPGRRPGAQPGNTNALKHGFYAQNLPPEDTAGLVDLPLDTLNDEITLLRILIRRVAETSSADPSPEKSIEYLRVVGLAMISLTRLMRTQVYLRAYRPEKIPLDYLLSDLQLAASASRGTAASAPAVDDLPEEPYTPLI